MKKKRERNHSNGECIFKEYSVKAFLGKGSYGRVYLVKNQVGVEFALKVLFRNVRMEKRGLEVIQKIRSNRVVHLVDYGRTIDGMPCVLMEYIPKNLEHLIGKGKLEEGQARLLFDEILKGLKILEDNRIIHRDIKPANMFVLEEIVKIGDFGTAKFVSGDSASMSEVAGTFHYMAPERFRNRYGFSVDRWSASVIFYRMLTGKFVFDGKDHTEIFSAIHLNDPNLDVVPERYRNFFRKCFKKNIRDRHGSVSEIQADLIGIPTRLYIDKKPRIHLRKEPMQVSDRDFRKVFRLTDQRRPREYIDNRFQDNRNGTVTDKTTGLIWQKSGSDSCLTYERVRDFVNELRLDRFAGFTDWRLPTVDELASLITPAKQNNGLYIDPIFNKKQNWCWSADMRSQDSAWFVYFENGIVYWHVLKFISYVRVVRP